MTSGEHINYNWGAPVNDDDEAFYEEAAVVPYYLRSVDLEPTEPLEDDDA